MDETDWLECKSRVEWSSKEDRAVQIARNILGFANRDPETARPTVGGEGYLLIGVEPGELLGCDPIDPADLENGLAPFLGDEGPRWSSERIPVGSVQVLFIMVSPPRAGDPIHVLRREIGKYQEGHVFVRRRRRRLVAYPAFELTIDERYSRLFLKPSMRTRLRSVGQDLILMIIFASSAVVFGPRLPILAVVVGVLALFPLADTVVNWLAYLSADSNEIRYLDYVVRRHCRTQDVSALRIDFSAAGGFSSRAKILNLLDSSGKQLMQISASTFPELGIAQLARMLGKVIGGEAAFLWLVDGVRRKQGSALAGDVAGEGGMKNLIRQFAKENSTGKLELFDDQGMQALYLVQGHIVKQVGVEEGEPLPLDLRQSASTYRFTPSAVPKAEIDLIAGEVDPGCFRPPL